MGNKGWNWGLGLMGRCSKLSRTFKPTYGRHSILNYGGPATKKDSLQGSQRVESCRCCCGASLQCTMGHGLHRYEAAKRRTPGGFPRTPGGLGGSHVSRADQAASSCQSIAAGILARPILHVTVVSHAFSCRGCWPHNTCKLSKTAGAWIAVNVVHACWSWLGRQADAFASQP